MGFGGGVLGEVVYVDVSGVDCCVKEVKVLIVFDVINFLIGLEGVLVVFGL